MIGLDTNVVVRYVTKDDPDQSARAKHLIESLDEQRKGFISLITLAEIHWVLRVAYRRPRPELSTIIQKLLDSRELVVQHHNIAQRALNRTTGAIDFPDALIAELGSAAGCEHTATFDTKAATLAAMQLVPPAPDS